MKGLKSVGTFFKNMPGINSLFSFYHLLDDDRNTIGFYRQKHFNIYKMPIVAKTCLTQSRYINKADTKQRPSTRGMYESSLVTL